MFALIKNVLKWGQIIYRTCVDYLDLLRFVISELVFVKKKKFLLHWKWIRVLTVSRWFHTLLLQYKITESY